jgi:hypothetical protein
MQDWTIVRPDERRTHRGCSVPTQNGVLTEDTRATGYITEMDLAQLLFQIIEAGSNVCKHRELCAVDPSFSYKSSSVKFTPFLL